MQFNKFFVNVHLIQAGMIHIDRYFVFCFFTSSLVVRAWLRFGCESYYLKHTSNASTLYMHYVLALRFLVNFQEKWEVIAYEIEIRACPISLTFVESSLANRCDYQKLSEYIASHFSPRYLWGWYSLTVADFFNVYSDELILFSASLSSTCMICRYM